MSEPKREANRASLSRSLSAWILHLEQAESEYDPLLEIAANEVCAALYLQRQESCRYRAFVAKRVADMGTLEEMDATLSWLWRPSEPLAVTGHVF